MPHSTPTEGEQLLLNELNHRVKNSLQTVASVLRIQANHDEGSRPALIEAALRVTAIARVHASLYQTRRSDMIGNYLHDILDDLRQVIPMNLKEDITPVHLPVEMAVPLALFCVEAVTNAAKHADGHMSEPPHIRVQFGPELNDRWFMEISDSGHGFPADFEAMYYDLEGSAFVSFGMKLMRAFAVQLNAQISFANRSGGVVRLAGEIVHRDRPFQP